MVAGETATSGRCWNTVYINEGRKSVQLTAGTLPVSRSQTKLGNRSSLRASRQECTERHLDFSLVRPISDF